MKNRLLNKIKYIKAGDIASGVSLLGSILFATLGLFGYMFSPTESLFLIMFGLLVTAFMLEKKSEQKFREKIIRIATSKPISNDFLLNLSELPPFSLRLENTKELWVSGLTLVGFTVSNRIELRKFILDGGKVRFLIAPKTGIVSDLSTNYTLMDKQRYETDIEMSNNMLKEWMVLSNNVEVRVLPVFPSHYLLLRNPEETNGEAQVHLVLYRQSSDTAPLFIVHREDSIEQFSAFRDEFLQLWNKSEILK